MKENQLEIEVRLDSDFLSTEEAAAFLRMLTKKGNPCAARVRNLVNQGRLPSYKPFGRLLFKKSDLLLIIDSSKQRRI
ncbi:MAG: helix-turn-helix domain-containing protein [Bdellovibrionales bacterium]|nr:helix-turn-helix domain-containing protein [Bdellovibrionales bacterium]